MNKPVEHGIRLMTHADLDKVRVWRNHPGVRRYMYTQHEISLEEHEQWFANASKDPARHLLIFEIGSLPLGFVNIHKVLPGGIADWGFYVAPDAAKGTGRLLGQAALRYAFAEAKMYKVCGQALAYNERSTRFHQALGFQEEGVLRQQHYNGQQYHDVVCFGLLATEWQSNN
ncbi:pseudaminic acid biosynthesis N-acetyltransferase [Pseudomonas sp. MT-1]|uniref:UDP-4-amino-4, 6-dideoxy-N-acetyl-beta-L-altrosamine N-acetyltransferase n=1 Tax=Stutzerimonas stutzeri TaxID=316 RepID=UPI000536433C|nr:pseudaminic acid biosynthesis N-acetyltransferase [Pseudomonas sp. MT-1]